ncbi:MAG: membrane protein insertase YidC [Gammaproteobacteria bacterium]
MDYKRLIVIFIIAMSGTMLWQAWQGEHGTATAETQSVVSDEKIAPELLTSADTASNSHRQQSIASTASLQQKSPQSHSLVNVKTDVLSLSIDPVGGALVNAQLLKYSQSLNEPNKPVILFNDTDEHRYIAKSGLVSAIGPTTALGQPTYKVTKHYYELNPQEEDLTVDLHWEGMGLDVTKRFVLHRGSYKVDVYYDVQNKTAEPWKGHFFGQLQRKDNPPPKSGFLGVSSYFGASVSSVEKSYQKVSFKQMKKNPLSLTSKGGWIAMQQHYFLTAWVPSEKEVNHYFSKVLGNENYAIGVVGTDFTVAPASEGTTKATLYVGPELPKMLDTIAPHLALTIDYGWLWFISMILFWLMDNIYSVVGNWGWAIIGVTVLIKLAFYRLSAASYRSMAAMRTLQPKLQALKDKFGDDKQAMSQATIELYKQEKVNPLGGCLPILIQIPVFIALYWVLIESVQLRQAPFILWIHDLSVKDPYYVLPIIMGLSMLIQQRLSPTPPDAMQAKLMYLMPVVFTALFLNFPAGLVLYWVVNNGLSILQQWYIMNRYDDKSLKKASNVFKSKRKP